MGDSGKFSELMNLTCSFDPIPCISNVVSTTYNGYGYGLTLSHFWRANFHLAHFMLQY